jgi:hypothetical protein
MIGDRARATVMRMTMMVTSAMTVTEAVALGILLREGGVAVTAAVAAAAGVAAAVAAVAVAVAAAVAVVDRG